MAIQRLVSIEASSLQNDQVGFDIVLKDERDIDGEDHLICYPGTGTDNSNIVYMGNTDDNAHWIGLHNAATSLVGIPIPIQAESLVGDNLTKDTSSSFDYDTANYINLAPGDVVYGKFKSVGILKSAGPTNHKYYLRMIRGV